MNAIEFNNITKKFKKGEKFNSLRDSIPAFFNKSLKNKIEKKREKQDFVALDNVNFSVKKGEVVGIMGPNGAGKSTILKLLSRIMNPNEGEVKINGRLSALIEITAGFHPELTGRENIYLNGTILGMKRKEIDDKYDEIVEFSGIGEFIDTPVKRYSSGMYSRLGFSVASHMDPDILLVDEVLAVGDMAFKAQCSEKMRELLKSGKTIVLVSHSLALLQSLCTRAILLQNGKIVMDGKIAEVIPYYQNIVLEKAEEDFRKKNKINENRVKVDTRTLASIVDVSIQNEKGETKNDFGVEEFMQITVNYATRERIADPAFFVEIVRSDGVSCCASSSRENGSRIGYIDGKGEVKIKLGKLKLAAGVYMAKLSIWDKDMIHPYVLRNRDVIRVIDSGSIRNADPVFLPDIKWENSKGEK